MDERRKFSRILFDANAYLDQAESTWRTTILDLSLNGALVEIPETFSDTQNGNITLEFVLPDSDIQLVMNTKIVHKTSKHLGLRCLHIDVESISHLRRIIELNLGDAELLNRELEMLTQPEE